MPACLVIQYKENNEETENKLQRKLYKKLRKKRQQIVQKSEMELKRSTSRLSIMNIIIRRKVPSSEA